MAEYKPMDRDVFEHFRVGLRTGEFVPMPLVDVERIVDQHYLEFEPLVPLTNGESRELRERLVRLVGGYINGQSVKKDLCRQDHQVITYTSAGKYIRGDGVHRVGDSWERQKKKIVFPEELEYELGQIEQHGNLKPGTLQIRPWTYEEKLACISNVVKDKTFTI